MEIIYRKGNTIIFILKNINLGLANALRRVLIADIPTYSIDLVTFYRNDSLLDDEFIAHRLGMVVISSGNYNTEIKLNDIKLNIENDGYDPIDITTDMIISNDIKLLYPKTLLTKIHRNQGINLIATIKSGTGSEHAKWNPVCGISMEQIGEDVKFNLEGTGAIDNIEIIKTGLNILDKKLSEIDNLISK